MAMAAAAATLAASDVANDVRPQAVTAGPPARDCADCPEMIEVRVKLQGGRERRYRLGAREVTWADYLKAVRDGGCRVPGVEFPRPIVDPDDPKALAAMDDDVAVSFISIGDATCYLAYLSKRTGKTYRLPTPDEWRWAAYGTATTRYPWGDDIGWNRTFMADAFDDVRYPMPSDRRGEVGARRVGQLAPNALGFFDIIGNAGEFVAQRREVRAKRRDGTPILKPDGTPFTNTAAIGGRFSWHPDHPRRDVEFIIDGAYLGNVGLRPARD